MHATNYRYAFHAFRQTLVGAPSFAPSFSSFKDIKDDAKKSINSMNGALARCHKEYAPQLVKKILEFSMEQA